MTLSLTRRLPTRSTPPFGSFTRRRIITTRRHRRSPGYSRKRSRSQITHSKTSSITRTARYVDIYNPDSHVSDTICMVSCMKRRPNAGSEKSQRSLWTSRSKPGSQRHQLRTWTEIRWPLSGVSRELVLLHLEVWV